MHYCTSALGRGNSFDYTKNRHEITVYYPMGLSIQENPTLLHENKNDAYQPAHQRILISTF